MHRFAPSVRSLFSKSGKQFIYPSRFRLLHEHTEITKVIPEFEARSLDCGRQRSHVNDVQQHLAREGILKINLGFHDDGSTYLQDLIVNLHKGHGHGLPIAHSATRGWFWDIRPSPNSFQSPKHQARSETMEEFPWHTDCSYESSPPRFFALQVVQPDEYGGGTLSVLNVNKLLQRVSSSAQKSLSMSDFRIHVPPEFIKYDGEHSIIGSLLAADDSGALNHLRFREDIVTPLSARAGDALQELKSVLLGTETEAETIHLTSEMLPRGSIVLVDNRRWLHGRNEVKDPNRHLRRVRWDARPFTNIKFERDLMS
ncbi:hypothetical protein FQN54_006181 [Arachnomyces sp. PD_36]|nr:hypothetical protein FQN54_006181 [Arachnomyces sp. PD_36]